MGGQLLSKLSGKKCAIALKPARICPPCGAFSPALHASLSFFLGVGHNEPWGAVQVVGDGLHDVPRMRFGKPHEAAVGDATVHHLLHPLIAQIVPNAQQLNLEKHEPIVALAAHRGTTLRVHGLDDGPHLKYDVEEGCGTHWLFHDAKLLNKSNLDNTYRNSFAVSLTPISHCTAPFAAPLAAAARGTTAVTTKQKGGRGSCHAPLSLCSAGVETTLLPHHPQRAYTPVGILAAQKV